MSNDHTPTTRRAVPIDARVTSAETASTESPGMEVIETLMIRYIVRPGSEGLNKLTYVGTAESPDTEGALDDE